MIFVWKGKNIFLSYIAQVWKFLWWHVSIIYSGWNTKPAVLKLKCFLWCQAMTQLITWPYYNIFQTSLPYIQTWKVESQYSRKISPNNSKMLIGDNAKMISNRPLFVTLTCMCNMIKSVFLKKKKLSQVTVKQSTVFFYEQ